MNNQLRKPQNPRIFAMGSSEIRIRDFFAAFALNGLLGDTTDRVRRMTLDEMAQAAYQIADAMLVEREEPR